MKKFWLCICLILSGAFMLSGCGVSGNTAIVSLSFTKPIFYLDINCATELSYKAYPATSKNYSVGFHQNREGGYELKNGVVEITEAINFQPTLVTITSGSLSDSCYIVKKSYPSATKLLHNDFERQYEFDEIPEITIMTGATTSFSMMGQFVSYFDEARATEVNYELGDSAAYHKVSPEIFDFYMESSNPSVVTVTDNKDSLTVYAGERVGSAIISVFLVNSDGVKVNYSPNGNNESDFSKSCAKIKVNVVKQASESRLIASNSSQATVPVVSEVNGEIVHNYSFDLNSLTNGAEQTFDLFLLDSNSVINENETVLKSLNLLALNFEGLTISEEVISGGGVALSHYKITIKNENLETYYFKHDEKLVLTGKYICTPNGVPIKIIISNIES